MMEKNSHLQPYEHCRWLVLFEILPKIMKLNRKVQTLSDVIIDISKGSLTVAFLLVY